LAWGAWMCLGKNRWRLKFCGSCLFFSSRGGGRSESVGNERVKGLRPGGQLSSRTSCSGVRLCPVPTTGLRPPPPKKTPKPKTKTPNQKKKKKKKKRPPGGSRSSLRFWLFDKRDKYCREKRTTDHPIEEGLGEL